MTMCTCLQCDCAVTARLCENSLEALTDLIQHELHRCSEPGKLAYVEFDVHVGPDFHLYRMTGACFACNV